MRPPAGGDWAGTTFQVIAAAAVALLILLTQTILHRAAGNVAVVTTLRQGLRAAAQPGARHQAP